MNLTAGAVAIAVAADRLSVLGEAVLRYGRAGETCHGKEQNQSCRNQRWQVDLSLAGWIVTKKKDHHD